MTARLLSKQHCIPLKKKRTKKEVIVIQLARIPAEMQLHLIFQFL